MTTEGLARHLNDIEATEDKIMSVSRYTMMMTPEDSVSTWESVFDSMVTECNQERLLPMLYVANDVMQKAKAKKQLEYITCFEEKLPNAFRTALQLAPHLHKKLERMVNVWEDRVVVSKKLLQALRKVLEDPTAEEDLAAMNDADASSYPTFSLEDVPPAKERCGTATVREILDDANFRYNVTTWVHEKFEENVPHDLTSRLSAPIEKLDSREELFDFLKFLNYVEHLANAKQVCAEENKAIRKELISKLEPLANEYEEAIEAKDREIKKCDDFLSCAREVSKLEDQGFKFQSKLGKDEIKKLKRSTSASSASDKEQDGTEGDAGVDELLEGHRSKRQRTNNNQDFMDSDINPYSEEPESIDEEYVWNPVLRDYQRKSTLLSEEDWRD